jgi:hypothetical protein
MDSTSKFSRRLDILDKKVREGLRHISDEFSIVQWR